jgi:hypothetical protein
MEHIRLVVQRDVDVRTAIAVGAHAFTGTQQQNAKTVVAFAENHFPGAFVRDLGQQAKRRPLLRRKWPLFPVAHSALTSNLTTKARRHEEGQRQFLNSIVSTN